MKYWGYKHVSGTIHLKRFFSSEDVEDAHESSFCQTIIEPFEANSREEASQYLQTAIRNTEIQNSSFD